jgi:hypothetical protein
MDIDITDVYIRLKKSKSSQNNPGFAHFEIRTKSDHDYDDLNFDDLIEKKMTKSTILEWKYTFRETIETEQDLFDKSTSPVISRLNDLDKRSSMSDDLDELIHFVRSHSSRYDEVDLWLLEKHELYEIIGFRMEQSSFGS